MSVDRRAGRVRASSCRSQRESRPTSDGRLSVPRIATLPAARPCTFDTTSVNCGMSSSGRLSATRSTAIGIRQQAVAGHAAQREVDRNAAVDRRHRLPVRRAARRCALTSCSIGVAESCRAGSGTRRSVVRCRRTSPNAPRNAGVANVPVIVPCSVTMPVTSMSVCRMSTMFADREVVDVEPEVRHALGRQQSVRVDAPVAAVAQLEIGRPERPVRPTESPTDAASSSTRCRTGTSCPRAAAPSDRDRARSRRARRTARFLSCVTASSTWPPGVAYVTRAFTVSNAKPIALTLSASTPTASFDCGVRAFVHAYSLWKRRTKLPRATTFSPAARPRRSKS